MARSSNHVHQYQKVEWGKKKTIVWKCQIKGCNHYLHPEFILGVTSRCYKCGSSFLMTAKKLNRKRPKCDDCQHKTNLKAAYVEETPAARKTPDLSGINIDELLENLE